MDVNLAGARLLGRPREELLGAAFDAHIRGAPPFAGLNVGAIERDGAFEVVEISAKSIGRGRTIVHVRETPADHDVRAISHTAHDLNNALVVVSVFAGAIATRPELSRAAREELSHVRAATAHALGLTRELGVVGRRETAAFNVVDLNVLVRGAAPLLRGVLGATIELEVRENAQSAHVFVDVLQIERLLVNLAVNAREAMRTGGTFHLETRNTDDATSVVLLVTDSGTGMDERTAAHAFEADFSTKGKTRGAGLAIVRAIVERHHGELRFTSRIDEGTSVEIRLPIARR